MIICVVGARPNFMKMSPVIHALIKTDLPIKIVHTGQHYDSIMSSDILSELQIPKPHYYLDVKSGSHAVQTSKIMTSFEKICLKTKPLMVIVSGDVNSTLACALVSAKLHIPVAHVEAGLRSFDRTMPEEINRVLTDHMSELLFTSEESGNINLRKEGINQKNIHFVGNCMIDSLKKFISVGKKSKPWESYGFSGKDYILATLHRPSNVDDSESLIELVDLLNQIGSEVPIIFPTHPRTNQKLNNLSKKLSSKFVTCLEPLSYIKFIGMMSQAFLVLTDSGGIQEETTFLQVPCITIRDNTERPSTVELGTNILAGKDPDKVLNIFFEIIKNDNYFNNGKIPPLWDGKSGERIVEIINHMIK